MKSLNAYFFFVVFFFYSPLCCCHLLRAHLSVQTSSKKQQKRENKTLVVTRLWITTKSKPEDVVRISQHVGKKHLAHFRYYVIVETLWRWCKWGSYSQCLENYRELNVKYQNKSLTLCSVNVSSSSSEETFISCCSLCLALCSTDYDGVNDVSLIAFLS